jgi:hypothetical protein
MVASRMAGFTGQISVFEPEAAMEVTQIRGSLRNLPWDELRVAFDAGHPYGLPIVVAAAGLDRAQLVRCVHDARVDFGGRSRPELARHVPRARLAGRDERQQQRGKRWSETTFVDTLARTPMPISGLVVTLDSGSAECGAALSQLAADPRVTLGDAVGAHLPVVTETSSAEEAERLVLEIEELAGISHVSVVSIDLSLDRG